MRALVLCAVLAIIPLSAVALDDDTEDTDSADTDSDSDSDSDTDSGTDDLSGLAATEVAGEEGGMRCDVASASPAGWLLAGLGLVVATRRRLT